MFAPLRPMLDEIRQLYTFHHWANGLMLDAVTALSDEQRRRTVVSSFPSLQKTLAHMIGADWVWLMRWQGTSPQALPADWGELPFEQFRGVWSDVERKQTTFLTELTEERLHSVVRYVNFAGADLQSVLWKNMRHVVNHATYHRGQVTTLIRQLGGTPASTDMERFFRTAPDAA
jgi:uncharacterized damage-inducible protein DinB